MKENQLDSGYKTMEQPTISFKNRFEFLLNAVIKVTRILFPCFQLFLHLPRISCLFSFFQLIFPVFQTMIKIKKAPPSMESDWGV